MPINKIEEITNNTLPTIEPIKEIMDIFIPGIDVENVPRTNGFIWLAVGSGGSGKSSMVLNFFRSSNDKKKKIFRGVFDNIYYYCPETSYNSVKNHPFKYATADDNVFINHDLTPESLEELYNTLDAKKQAYVQWHEKKNKEKKLSRKKITKSKKAVSYMSDDEIIDDEDSEEEPQLEYSCLYIDDYADIFKNKEFKHILDKILIKTRHLCLAVIITLQELKYFPLKLRKQITNISLFKPKNFSEWSDIAKEYFNLSTDDSLLLYNYVFDKPYQHLDVQTNMGTNKYYKNWNELIFT